LLFFQNSARIGLRHLCVVAVLFLFPPSGRAWEILLEAERAGETIPPAHILTERGAHGGTCVRMSSPDAPAILQDSASLRGEIRFEVELPRAAEYVLWVRLEWHCTCSRALSIVASRTDLSIGKSPETGISDYAEPGVWHWVSYGPFEFESGRQTVGILQKGHLTLVDAICLTDDFAFRPPGYEESSRIPAVFENDASLWRKRGDGLFSQSPSAAEWNHFELNVLFDFRPGQLNLAADAVGVCHLSGIEIEVLCSPQEGEGWSVTLTRRDRNGARVLGRKTVVPNQGFFQSLRLVRLNGLLSVAVNGVPLFEMADEPSSPGTIAVLSSSTAETVFRRFEIRALQAFEETFTQGDTAWETLLGRWKPVSLSPESTRLASSYMACSSEANLCLSPFNLGESYTFETKINLPAEGYAGVALDVLDRDNWLAVVLNEDRSRSPRSSTVAFLQAEESSIRSLWSRPVSTEPGAWRDLSVTREEHCVRVSVDGGVGAVLEKPSWNGGTGLGLVASGGSHALFSAPGARDFAGSWEREYLFEPENGPASLTHWFQREGVFTFNPHPAYLRCRPAAGHDCFELRLWRPLPPRFEVAVDYDDDREGEISVEETSDGLEDLPDLSLPPLPGGLRLGLGFRVLDKGKEEPLAEYRFAVDGRDMRDMVVFRNGERINQVSTPPTADPRERTLFAKIDAPETGAGVGETVFATQNEPALAREGAFVQPFLFADGMEAGADVKVRSISIRETPTSLPGTDTAPAEFPQDR